MLPGNPVEPYGTLPGWTATSRDEPSPRKVIVYDRDGASTFGLFGIALIGLIRQSPLQLKGFQSERIADDRD